MKTDKHAKNESHVKYYVFYLFINRQLLKNKNLNYPI